MGGEPEIIAEKESMNAVKLGLPASFVDPVLIGAGGMGAVYRVTDTSMARVVAVKVIRVGALGEIELKRFRGEAKALGRLDHPNVIKVHSIGMTEATAPYMVLEFVDGEGLDKLLEREHRLEEPELRRLFTEVAAGLEHAHAHGVIHRDVKPGNILVSNATESGAKYRVVDFGIARLSNSGLTQELTRTGMIIGSPAYVSPEQCVSGHIDARSDIYSLGCVIFQAAAGRPPFVGDNSLEVMTQHCMCEAPTVREVCPDSRISHRMETIIARCLAKSPDDRFESTSELLAALDQDIEIELTKTATGANRAKSSARVPALQNAARKRNWSKVTLAAVASCLTAMIAGGFFFFESTNHRVAPPSTVQDSLSVLPTEVARGPEYLLDKGINLRCTGHPQDAEPYFELAHELAVNSGLRPFKFLYEQAHNELMIGKPKVARDHFQDALDALSILTPGKLTADEPSLRCLLGQAESCDQERDADGIDTYVRKVETRCNGDLNPDLIYHKEVLRAHAELIRKQYANAEKRLLKLQQFYKEARPDETFNLACLIHETGLTQLQQNKFNAARKSLKRALQIHNSNATDAAKKAAQEIQDVGLKQIDTLERHYKGKAASLTAI